MTAAVAKRCQCQAPLPFRDEEASEIRCARCGRATIPASRGRIARNKWGEQLQLFPMPNVVSDGRRT